MMRFYNQPHRFYAGIDLHARTMHVCVLSHEGSVVLDKNLPCHFDSLLQALAPFSWRPAAARSERVLARREADGGVQLRVPLLCSSWRATRPAIDYAAAQAQGRGPGI